MLWHDREYSLPDDRFIPREHLGAARGAVYCLIGEGLLCLALPFLGWLLAGIRYP